MNLKKFTYFYWVLPIGLWGLQALMTFHSLNQMRFEEIIESVQAPFWLDQRQIISGLHVNVGWYAYLLIIYKIFGFSLHTGKMAYLVISAISSFCLANLLKQFFERKVASLILTTIVLSPTLLYMNTLNLHWGMTFHLMIIILLLLYILDFSKRSQSLILTGIIFLLMMVMWFFYQAVVFYIPSLVIFYWLKLKQFYGSRIKYGMTKKMIPHLVVSAMAFFIPLVMLFSYVENRNILILDHDVGGGLFRGGGRFEFSENVFSQAWTDFISDFFNKGVSHHFEVYLSEFSLVFPIITLLFMVYCIWRIFKQVQAARTLILLALLVMVFDIVVFSTTSDLGLPGMKRVTPILVSVYFLWILVWYYLSPRPSLRATEGSEAISTNDRIASSKTPRNDVKRKVAYLVLSLLTIHHLIVYPINLIHIKDNSPFKVTDWFDPAPYGAGFDEQNPQESIEMYVKEAQKGDLILDCRPIIAQAGGCSYDFIYPAVAGSCKWNNLNCHDILGYDPKTGQFIPLDVRLWEENYFEH